MEPRYVCATPDEASNTSRTKGKNFRWLDIYDFLITRFWNEFRYSGEIRELTPLSKSFGKKLSENVLYIQVVWCSDLSDCHSHRGFSPVINDLWINTT